MRPITRRTFSKTAAAASAAMAAPAILAHAADKPIRIGFSIAQTGGIAAGGKAGLTARLRCLIIGMTTAVRFVP